MSAFKIHSDLQHNTTQIDERVQWFYQRFKKLYRHEAHFVLACHAAFPIALTADLLYQIWINFQPMIKQPIPYEAVSDILLSPLCEEVRPELFEMDKSVRDYLLANLNAHPDYGPQRLRQLAHFLIAYSKATFTKNYEATLAKSQRVTAIAYLDPELAAQEIVGTLNQLSDAQAREELGRVSDLVETLDVPLAQLPELINYSKALGAELRGNSIQAQRLMAGLQVAEEVVENDNKEVIEVAGSMLYVNEQLRKLVRTKIQQSGTKSEWSTNEVGYWDEAKVMVVGPDGGGKTTLVRQILGNPFSPRDTSDSNIELNHFHIQVPLRGDTVNVNAHIWDIGNQETKHETDQLFYTSNTLYLLVFSNRHTPREILSWVARVSSLSSYSPVLILLNEFDDQEAVVVDQQLIQQQYANVVDCIRVNAARGQGAEELNEALRTQLSRLTLLRKKIPASWVRLRQELNNEQVENQLPLEEFMSLCARYGIENSAEISQLFQDLNQLGLIIHYADDPVLRPVVFLQHSWLTKAIHRILDLSTVKSSGRFSIGQLGGILGWSYGQSQFNLLLTVMQRIGLCFSREEEKYIVPISLPEGEPPTMVGPPADTDLNNIRYQFNYTLRFPNVFPKLLEKMKTYIQEVSLSRNRALFQFDISDARAVVIRDPSRNKLDIYAWGNKSLDILYQIRIALEQIHEEYPGIIVKEMIPCPCSECRESDNPHLFDKAYILNAEERGVQQLTCVKSGEDVPLEDLLRLIKHIPLEVTIEEAEELIAKGNLIAGVKLLVDAYTIKAYSTVNTQLLLYYGQLNTLVSRHQQGIILESEYQVSRGNITAKVLEEISQLREAIATGQITIPDPPAEEEEQIEVQALIVATREEEADFLATHLEEIDRSTYPGFGPYIMTGYIRRTQKKVHVAILTGFGVQGVFRESALEKARRYKADMILLIGEGFQGLGASKEEVKLENIVVGTLINSITFNEEIAKFSTYVTSVDVELISHARTINKENTWLTRMREDRNQDGLAIYFNSQVRFGQIFAGARHQLENRATREILQSTLEESLVEVDFAGYDIMVKLSENIPKNKRFVIHGVFPSLLDSELQLDPERNAVKKAAAFATELVAYYSGYGSKSEAAYQCGDWETIETIFEAKMKSEESITDHLLLYSTRKQQTWLITTETRLFLLLDDIDQAKTNRYIQWEMSHEEALSRIEANPKSGPKTLRSGLLNIGSRKNWYYSHRLFPEPQQLEEAIREMLARAQQTGFPNEPLPDLPEQNIQQQNFAPESSEESIEEPLPQRQALSSVYGRIHKLLMACRSGDWISSMLTLKEWLAKLPPHIQLVIWTDSVEELVGQLSEWDTSYRVRSSRSIDLVTEERKERCYIIPSPVGKRTTDENHHWIGDAFFVQTNSHTDTINIVPTSAELHSDENIDLAQMLAGTGYLDLDTGDAFQSWLQLTPNNVLIERDFALVGRDSFNKIVEALASTPFFRKSREVYEAEAQEKLKALLGVDRLHIVGVENPSSDRNQPFPSLDQCVSLADADTILVARLEDISPSEITSKSIQLRNRALDEIAHQLNAIEDIEVIRNPVPVIENRYEVSSESYSPLYNNCLVEVISPIEKNVYLPTFKFQQELARFNEENQSIWRSLGFNVILIDQMVPQNNFELYAPRNIVTCLDRETS